MIVDIKSLLDKEVLYRNSADELSFEKPDPLLIAKKYNNEYIGLVCALFAYGNAKKIVELLDSFNFDILNCSEDVIKKELKSYYRFQTNLDIVEFFITIKRLQEFDSIENIVYDGYKKASNILEGIDNLIKSIIAINSYSSKGYKFLILDRFKRQNGSIKPNKNAPYKRYNMFLRWMVRKDMLDMGLWSKIDKKDLILPLDTHTHKISLKLGLVDRKSYDLQTAILITNRLKEFDITDPIKYDFALYRIGQENIFL